MVGGYSSSVPVGTVSRCLMRGHVRLRRGGFLHAATMSLLVVNLDERERGVGRGWGGVG